MEDKKLKITFADKAFVKSVERTELGRSRSFTRLVAEMNKAAEVLDRHDEFSVLSVAPERYAQNGTGYGIPQMSQHIGDERLLPNQVTAAKRFLRELRGFGLLADVVGSGKTYEACAVLSELAAKGKISTLLLIVPTHLKDMWTEVLESRFGLGKGVLQTIGKRFEREKKCTRSDGGFYIPNAPYIVTAEDFASWSNESVSDVLFDAVVVDEAHNLCVEDGDYAHALQLLSYLMQTKKRAVKTYCILLSATPHSGNLENMFRLWYFIRCKGGDPRVFSNDGSINLLNTGSQKAENLPNYVGEYLSEKKHYYERVCHSATTVMEFIEKVRFSEVTGKHSAEFYAYLSARGVKGEAAFMRLAKGVQKKHLSEFLSSNENIARVVNEEIASAYHAVLRSIMIRQPRGNNGISKSKRVENIFFFPSSAKKTDSVVCQGLNGKNITVNLSGLDTDKAITTPEGSFSVESYVRKYKGAANYSSAYADLFFNNGILAALGLKSDKKNESSWGKRGAISYYWNQTTNCNVTDPSSSSGIGIRFMPLFDNTVLEAKLEQLEGILKEYKNERVIVFFDYDAPSNECCYDEVIASLQKSPEFASRLIIGSESEDKETIQDAFDKKSDAVLIVTTRLLTEGTNFQKSRVIVNFQVTPNPLAMEQRIGRIFRYGQENDVKIYSLADMRALEGYVLMYFNAIGLMTSNDGDAAIIAGCNNDGMVTLRCRACGRVKLISNDEYDEIKEDPEKQDELYCREGRNGICTQTDKRGTLMHEINNYELKCTTEGCHAFVRRAADGRYYCFTHNEGKRGVLCSSGEKGDRQLYCSKICVISKCNRFNYGELEGKCPALNRYRENPLASRSELETLCNECTVSESVCPARCRLTHGDGASAISACTKCDYSQCTYPKPHVIEFDESWSAECPVCKEKRRKGKIKPVVARTFETFIRFAYDYELDGGASFCSNLFKETEKVSYIKEILAKDDERRPNG